LRPNAATVFDLDQRQIIGSCALQKLVPGNRALPRARSTCSSRAGSAAGIAPLMLATSAAAQGGDTDVVNERPPVTRSAS
jgi:hypothetical protein